MDMLFWREADSILDRDHALLWAAYHGPMPAFEQGRALRDRWNELGGYARPMPILVKELGGGVTPPERQVWPMHTAEAARDLLEHGPKWEQARAWFVAFFRGLDAGGRGFGPRQQVVMLTEIDKIPMGAHDHWPTSMEWKEVAHGMIGSLGLSRTTTKLQQITQVNGVASLMFRRTMRKMIVSAWNEATDGFLHGLRLVNWNSNSFKAGEALRDGNGHLLHSTAPTGESCPAFYLTDHETAWACLQDAARVLHALDVPPGGRVSACVADPRYGYQSDRDPAVLGGLRMRPPWWRRVWCLQAEMLAAFGVDLLFVWWDAAIEPGTNRVLHRPDAGDFEVMRRVHADTENNDFIGPRRVWIDPTEIRICIGSTVLWAITREEVEALEGADQAAEAVVA